MNMKKMMSLSLLTIAACAVPAASLRSSADLSGPWSGVLVRGGTRSLADFRFSSEGDGERGFFWSRALTPVELTGIRLGEEVHFEVPQVGVFDGTSDGETMQGTFRDQDGGGSFKLAKQPDPDDPKNVMF